jgi:hypothetical protein
METVTEAITGRIEAERELLREFILEHSGGLRDLNTPDSGVFIMGPSRAGRICPRKATGCSRACSM